MSVTIKKIAEISGVSRGTVDRVLNKRGKVSPDKTERVLSCAKKLGYTPNLAGKALAVTKKNHVVGIVLNSEQNEFFEEIISEINEEIINFKNYGIRVVLKTMKGYDPKKQLKLLHDLPSELSGLIITPVDDKMISEKLNELCDKNVCVITLNNDIKDCKRMCYVGSNYYNGGKISAGIVKLIKPNGANIGVVQGTKKLFGHNQRLLGFMDELSSEFNLVNVCESQDDDEIAYNETLTMLKNNASIDTIFIVAAGVLGVCRAIASTQREISVVCFDDTKTTIELMNQDKIKVLISQQARVQGKKVMQIMLDYFVKNEIANEFIVENQIKIKQNFN